jgi:phosphate transport system protein
MRERFSRQMGSLRDDLLRLGSMVEYALDRSVRSLETWDTIAAAQILHDDARIDDAQHAAEEEVYRLMALQQPVATDLRLLGTVMAVATELERIGDYACGIARRIRRATRRPMLVTPPPALYEMATISQKMLHTSLDAFLHQDADMARSLSIDDERVDMLEDRLRSELIVIAHADAQKIEAVIDMLDVVHVLERVADRATNIGERVIYLVTSTTEALNP